MSDYWCALVIRGVGDEQGSYAFCLGDPTLTPVGYSPVPLLTNYPQNLSATLDPIKVEYDLSGFTFAISAESPWLSLFTRRIYLAEGALITAVAADDTTLEIAYSGAFNPGEFVYLGKESILLGTLDSSTSYVDPATGQVVSYDVFVDCERGALGSVAEPHGVSDFDDNRVYAYPELAGRLCDFLEMSEGDDQPMIVWRGQVVDIRLEDDDESTIFVDTSDLLSILSTRKLNKTPYQGITTDDILSRSVGVRPGWVSFWSRLDEDTRSAYIQQGKTSKGGSNVRLALQVGDALTSGLISTIAGEDAEGSWYGYTTTDSLGQKSYIELGSEIKGEEEGSWSRVKKGSRIFEVLCFGQDFVNPHGVYYGCGTNRVDRDHPLHLLLLVLLSTGFNSLNSVSWDKIGANWSLGIPEYLVDVAGIEAEMVRTPELKLDRLVLGWGGAEWSIRDLIDKALRPVGYYLRFSRAGKITVDRIKPLTDVGATEIDFRRVIEMSERLDRRMGSATQKIRASFGFPWGEQSSITFQNRGKQARLWWPESDTVGADFDMTAFQSPDGYGKGAGSVYLAWVLQLMWRPIPVQHVTVQGVGSDDLWPGKTVALIGYAVGPNSDGSVGVLVDKDGARTDATLLGLVVSSEYSPQEGTWTLGLWLQNEPLRGAAVLVPPSAPVEGYNATTGVLTVTRLHLGVDLAEFIGVGSDVFVLCDRYHVPRAWAAPLTFVTPASITVNVDTLEIDFGSLSTANPEFGDWLRFAEYGQQFGGRATYLFGASDVPRLNTTDPPKWYV